MNHCVPDWNVVSDSRSFSDLPGRNQKKSMGLDQELMEILWHNGQVVLNSQTNRKPTAQSIESKQVLKIDHSLKGNGCIGISNDPVQDDETSAWIQYPVDDSLEKEFYPDYFYELPSNYTNSSDKPKKQIIVDEMEEFLLGGTVKSQLTEKESSDLNHGDNLMPPPRSQLSDAFPKDQNKCTGKITNFSHFSRPFKTNLGSSAPTQVSHVIHGEAGESSGMTVASSHCRSNQVQNDNDVTQILTYYQCDNKDYTGSVSENPPKVLHQQNRAKSDFLEPTATSSSGGSGGSYGRSNKQDASNESNKRKVRDGEESESHSEEAEYGSADTNRPPKHSTPSRRSRAAEVHNLSERRRRDRINEKMKALQELIPHCNKTDKASMLDEAIEYLKSLQLQLQMMWMGSGMAPMMFPGVQHFMPHMGMGMGMARPPLPSMSNHMPFPRVPLVSPSVSLPPVPNQPQLCSSKAINPMNFPIQVPNSNVPDAYARYLGFHHMQAATQAMNLFTYGPQLTSPSSTNAPCGGTIPLNNTPSDKSGQ